MVGPRCLAAESVHAQLTSVGRPCAHARIDRPPEVGTPPEECDSLQTVQERDGPGRCPDEVTGAHEGALDEECCRCGITSIDGQMAATATLGRWT